jgi:hypothetical protein
VRRERRNRQAVRIDGNSSNEHPIYAELHLASRNRLGPSFDHALKSHERAGATLGGTTVSTISVAMMGAALIEARAPILVVLTGAGSARFFVAADDGRLCGPVESDGGVWVESAARSGADDVNEEASLMPAVTAVAEGTAAMTDEPSLSIEAADALPDP